MTVLIIVCILVLITSIVILLHAKHDYESFIKKMASQKTFEEIDKIIAEDKHILDNGNFKGEIYEEISDHKDMWEEVREHKVKQENTQDEIAVP